MYFLVLYNLSPIQQGIQAGHCAIEYSLKAQKDEVYKQRANKDKTFIILNGGTSQNLKEYVDYLAGRKIKHATFVEPDLNNTMTCVCFLSKPGDDLTKFFTPLFKLA